jgi:hypothetical protein
MSEVAAASPIAALPMAGEPARGQRNGVPDCDEGGLNLAAFVAKHAARSLDPSNPAAANPAAAAATASAAAASLPAEDETAWDPFNLRETQAASSAGGQQDKDTDATQAAGTPLPCAERHGGGGGLAPAEEPLDAESPSVRSGRPPVDYEAEALDQFDARLRSSWEKTGTTGHSAPAPMSRESIFALSQQDDGGERASLTGRLYGSVEYCSLCLAFAWRRWCFLIR